MKPTGSKGVTLLELVVTVAIVGILAAIAYPSYLRYTAAARRSDAYTGLPRLANDLEKFYSECGAYTSNITGARSCTAPAGPPPGTLGKSTNQSTNGYYQFSIALPPTAGVPPGGYLVTASAIGTQSSDKDCQTLTLSSTGAKSATAGSGGDISRCWRK